MSAGDPARAVTVLQPLRESGETASLVLLSLALADRGANDEALALLDRAHREAQPPAEFFESLGLALLRLDRIDRARTAFEEAVRSSPDLASAWNSPGIVRFRQYERDAAPRHGRTRSRPTGPARCLVQPRFDRRQGGRSHARQKRALGVPRPGAARAGIRAPHRQRGARWIGLATMTRLSRLTRSCFPLIAALLAFACHRATSVQPSPGAPVVLVTIDTLRADHLPLWGYAKVETPAIDALGRDGVLFHNAYSQVPLTLPSHASLLTGLLPYEDGVRSNTGFRLDTSRHPTLAALLKAKGYATGAAVSAYVLRRETGIATDFDYFNDSLEVREGAALNALQRPGGESLDAVLAWLDGVGKRPFFLWLHLYEPHTPYEAPEPYRSRFAPYDAEIAAADAIVGRLVSELKTRGLYDSSLLVMTSDHGEGLGDHGEVEHGALVPRPCTCL